MKYCNGCKYENECNHIDCRYKCDFCGNDKFLNQKSLVVDVEKHYIKTTKEFIICSKCLTKLEDTKLQAEIDFIKQNLYK